MSRPAHDAIDSRLSEILKAPESTWPGAIDGLCGEYPEEVQWIRERFLAVRDPADSSPKLAPAEPLPTRIGPFRILSRLGEGGMGTVYIAEQQEPVRRRVAVKVVKLGMDSKRVLARFDAERQALAMMNHPHIAKVLDAGTTERGQPYFVMDLVKGIPITDYCDKNRLGIRARVELLQQICSGVQHAHLKGIIHRDIKPSNILVEVQADKPIARIIDFGLARATDHQLTAHTIFTEQGEIIGTPEYMSPEQAEMTGIDIDTRTDVYSLGVLLYELLTGELPLAAGKLRSANPVEMQRMIREESPAVPSARLRPATAETEQTAQRRSTTTITLQRELRGELDWIVMRALEKDRTRRYQSPSDLRSDLDRYLRGEPVLAGPPSLRYRLQKLLRRHRGPVLAAAMLLLSLVAGLTVSTILYFDAQRQAGIAHAQERVVRQQKEQLESFADHNQLRDLRQELDQLWPEVRSMVPLMESWLQRAERLAQRAEPCRAQIAQLRQQARTLSDAELRVAREQIPLNRGLAEAEREVLRLRSRLTRIQSDGAVTSAQIQEVEAEITLGEARVRELRADVAPVRQHVLADAAAQAQLDTLERFAAELEEFTKPGTGAIAAVRRRIETAARLEDQTIEEGRTKWDEAIRRIAANPSYARVRLRRPQWGLLPLGPDPHSLLEEFWHPRSGTEPRRRTDTKGLEFEDGTAMVFVLLPGGDVALGAQKENDSRADFDREAEPNETPVGVSLTPFFLAKHEMTQHQWLELCGENPSKRPPGSTRQASWKSPVERVDALQCDRVLRRHRLLLPTDAQWEDACRGGTTTPWFTGDAVESLEGHVNVKDQSCVRLGWTGLVPWDDEYLLDAPVDSFRPNPFGLRNMAGNIMEWCRDSYERIPMPDGRALRSGDGEILNPGTDRCFRGGAYDKSPHEARSAKRQAVDPHSRFDNVGLRAMRTIDD